MSTFISKMISDSTDVNQDLGPHHQFNTANRIMATEFHHRAITTSRSTNNSISTEIESKLVTETSLQDAKCHINSKLELNNEISSLDGNSNDNRNKNPTIDNNIIPSKERKKRYEETIIDGFAITAFKTLEDLDDEVDERASIARSQLQLQQSNQTRNETQRTATDNINTKKSIKHKSHSTSSNSTQNAFTQDVAEPTASSGNSHCKDSKKKSKDKTKLKTACHSHNSSSKDQLKRSSNKSSSSDNTTLQEAIEAKERAEKRLSILQEKLKQEQNKNRQHNNTGEQCNSQQSQLSSNGQDFYNSNNKSNTQHSGCGSQPAYYSDRTREDYLPKSSNFHQLGPQRGPPNDVIMDHDLMKDPILLGAQLQPNRSIPSYPPPYQVNSQIHRTSVQSGNYHHSTTMTTMQAVHQQIPPPPPSPNSQQNVLQQNNNQHHHNHQSQYNVNSNQNQQMTSKPLHSTPPPSLSQHMQAQIPSGHLSYLYQRQSSPQVNQTTSTQMPPRPQPTQPPLASLQQPPPITPQPSMPIPTSQPQSQSHLTGAQGPPLHHLSMAFPRPPLPGSGISHPQNHNLVPHPSHLGHQPSALMSAMNPLGSHPSPYGCPPSVYITDTIHRQTSIIPPPGIGAPPVPHPAALGGTSLTPLNPPASRFASMSQTMMPYNPAAPAHPSMYYPTHPAERSFYEFARTYTGPGHLGHTSWINTFGSTTTASAAAAAASGPYNGLDRWQRLDPGISRHPAAPMSSNALPDTIRAYASIANHGLFPPPYF